MGFRITTNMMMNSYRYNLQNSTKRRSDSADRVLTQRNFNSYSDDPAAATLAFRLRRDWCKTTNYLNNTKDVYSKFNTAWNNLGGVIKDLSDATARVASIRGNNGTAGESRKTLAVVLRETSESVIHAMNQQLGDHFIFSGNDALNVPFSWEGETLLYRGVNVNAGEVPMPTAEEPTWMTDLEANGLTADQQAWYDYYMHRTVEKPDPAENPEPGWLTPGAADSVVTAPLSTVDQGWIDYYQHKTDEKPTAEAPAWLDNAKTNAGTDWTDNDEAWYQFLSGAPDSKIPDVSTRPQWAEDMLGQDKTGLTDIERGWLEYYNDRDDISKLDTMSKEEMYIDLGMGAEESSPNHPVKGTYFNSALSGIDYTGYGVDEDGDPKNLALVMRKLADVFETWDEDGQRYLPEKYRDMSYSDLKALMENDKDVKAEIETYHKEHEQAALRLMDKLKAAQEHTTEKYNELNANSVFLQTNQSRLTTEQSDLNTEILDVEQVDLAEAITTFSWDMYCYNAALKIGTQLLSQSLIDYMS